MLFSTNLQGGGGGSGDVSPSYIIVRDVLVINGEGGSPRGSGMSMSMKPEGSEEYSIIAANSVST